MGYTTIVIGYFQTYEGYTATPIKYPLVILTAQDLAGALNKTFEARNLRQLRYPESLSIKGTCQLECATSKKTILARHGAKNEALRLLLPRICLQQAGSRSQGPALQKSCQQT